MFRALTLLIIRRST